jgi:hypothetical protein
MRLGAALAASCLVPHLAAEDPAFRAGASVVDIAPAAFPVIVNAMFEERSANRVVDSLETRSIVIDDGRTRLAIAIVDTCMMGRDLIDEARAIAAKETGIPGDRMLVAATHTHSAPSAMGCLGSRMDPAYRRLLPGRIALGIAEAAARLEPARAAWGSVRAPDHTFNRRWIRRPDRLLADPFGQQSVRAHMHPGHESPDAIGPSGPIDDELSVVSFVSPQGHPIALLANFSMHYYESPLLSSDYFGRFRTHVEKLLTAPPRPAGPRPFVAMMSQGTSGDLMWMDYSRPRQTIGYDAYALGLARPAADCAFKLEHRDGVPIALHESRLTLRRRTPDAERLAWARKLAATIGDRLPRGLPEIYALEQIHLHDDPVRELKLQALRIGDLGIAAMPNEVFAITGLKLKEMSPFAHSFTIELANGAEGYIPPPEQHRLGGYTTWPARTAGLEVEAEPRILEGALQLLEQAAGKPRRAPSETHGPLARATLELQPLAYWRLGEMNGATAADATGSGRAAALDGLFALALEGPRGEAFSGNASNRAVHLAGGRLKARLDGLGPAHTVSLWFWNGLPADARPVTGYLVSRGKDGAEAAPGDHLGIGGTAAAAGKLFFFNGNRLNQLLAGRTALSLKAWHHVLLVRDGKRVAVYLDGAGAPDLEGEIESGCSADEPELFLGGRSDGFASLEGKLDEVAVWGKALEADAARGLCGSAR